MNKIKVLYDVVKVMRDKDAYNGVIEAAVSKDEVQVFRFNNEFSKDLAAGWTKARITTVIDHNGKQIKHESTTECNKKDESNHGKILCENDETHAIACQAGIRFSW